MMSETAMTAEEPKTDLSEIQRVLDFLIDYKAKFPIAMVATLARFSSAENPICSSELAHHAGIDLGSLKKHMSRTNQLLSFAGADFCINRTGTRGHYHYHLKRKEGE